VRIRWAIPCRGVDIPPDGMANLLGMGMNMFAPPVLPAEIRLVLALDISAREDELGHDYPLQATILDPNMEPAGDPQVPVVVVASPSKPPGWEQTSVLPLGVRFEARTAGTYTIQFTVDGRNQPEVALYVSNGQSGGPSAEQVSREA
jgi:hypothetical protein